MAGDRRHSHAAPRAGTTGHTRGSGVSQRQARNTRTADISSGEPAAVAASDAFFPFADGPKLLIDAGVRCLVHPGGSKRDQETLDLCQEQNVTCLLTGVRHFRH